MRKRYDIQDALRKPVKSKRVLRVFLSNMSHNQPWSKEGMIGFGVTEGDEDTPSWTLKIEGKLLDDSPKTGKSGTPKKFSSFVRSLVVEFDRSSISPTDVNVVEVCFTFPHHDFFFLFLFLLSFFFLSFLFYF